MFGKLKPTLKDKNGDSWAMNPNASKLIALWASFGNKSLQTILSEEVDCISCVECEGCCKDSQLKPEATALLDFIKELKLK